MALMLYSNKFAGKTLSQTEAVGIAMLALHDRQGPPGVTDEMKKFGKLECVKVVRKNEDEWTKKAEEAWNKSKDKVEYR